MILQDISTKTPIITINDLKETDHNGVVNTADYHANISCTSISKAINLTSIQIKTTNEVSISFEKTECTPVRFLYCHDGDFFIEMKGRQRRLSRFQNAILFENKRSDLNLKLKAHTSYHFNMISVNKNLKTYSAEESNLLGKMVELITKGDYKKERCYVSSRNLAIGMALKGLDKIDGENLGDKLILSGKIRVILGLEYQQLQNDLNSEENSHSALTRREMQRVSELIESIKNNPGNNYTVSSLSMEAGLSENKLQEGFKELFDRTVTDCIRNIRLEKAEELLKTTDLNVSEVVYSVGFISRSYFSKIFKAKYDCSPSFYKKQRQVEQVA